MTFAISSARPVPMPSPGAVHARLPSSVTAAHTVGTTRQALRDILDQRDERMFLVIGPCSIHDPIAALDYARRLGRLQREVRDVLLLVMRAYLEKPRTTTGWTGFVNDPDLDGSGRVAEGVARARRLLLDLAEAGVPAATEALDPLLAPYFDDLVAWTAVGARTTESQTHRQLASGFGSPVGFKNGTGGDVGVAVNAIVAASARHVHLGIGDDGQVAVLRTAGNPYAHLVLRGGDRRPNYDSVSVAMAEAALLKAGVRPAIVVDCSHGNSHKNPALQSAVLADVVHQVSQGRRSLVGAMVESNLVAGTQPLAGSRSELVYGCSITDACIGWEQTEEMVRRCAEGLRLCARAGKERAAVIAGKDEPLLATA